MPNVPSSGAYRFKRSSGANASVTRFGQDEAIPTPKRPRKRVGGTITPYERPRKKGRGDDNSKTLEYRLSPGGKVVKPAKPGGPSASKINPKYRKPAGMNARLRAMYPGKRIG